jgi:mRNA interferase MazF
VGGVSGRELPRQGELWWTQFDPVRGGEIRKTRPALVVSNNALHRHPLQLVMVVPLTTTRTGSSLHVEVRLQQERAERVGYALPEQIRSVSRTRLTRRIARVSPAVLEATRNRVALLLRDDI